MTEPAVTSTSSPPPATEAAKSKGILDLFRSPLAKAGDSNPGADNKDVVDLTEDVSKGLDLSKPAPPTSAEIATEWEAMVGEAQKTKKTVFAKLKRLGSKDGRAKEKEKAREVDHGELREEDIAAPVPLPDSSKDIPIPKELENIPGANTLGRRIQSILSNVPPFFHTVPPADNPSKEKQDTPSAEAPVKPAISDSKLLNFLSSASIMNGDPEDSKSSDPSGSGPQSQRVSVWTVLDRMVPYNKPTTGVPSTSAEGNPNFEPSLMLYAPLIPDENSQVTLAKSKLIEVSTSAGSSVLPKAVAKGVSSALWPEKFKLKFKKKDRSKSFSSENDGNESQGTGDATASGKNADKCGEVKVWIPSATKLSLQVAWWGYRLWLPPPVLRILDDKTVEAAKRAAMVTTALAWLINHVPTTGLPPQLSAAVALLKGIVPLLGYVGGFIAWSWSQVKSFDKGQGVVLSATWLLPIALIPGTWDDSDYGGDRGTDSGRATPTPPEAPSTGPPQTRTPGTSTPATGAEPVKIEPPTVPEGKSSSQP